MPSFDTFYASLNPNHLNIKYDDTIISITIVLYSSSARVAGVNGALGGALDGAAIGTNIYIIFSVAKYVH